MSKPAFAPLRVEFDDVIFALQSSGGASVYWQEMTSRVVANPNFRVTRIAPSRWKRGIPAFSSADVFHSSHFRVAAAGGARNISTVYDLTYELGLMKPGLGSRLNLLERRVSFATAKALICISENTRRDLLQIYPRLLGRCPVFVIHLAVSIPGSDSRAAARAMPDFPYALYVGGRKSYKDFTTALEGFRASGASRSGVRLLCTGAALDTEEDRQIAMYGLEGMVVSVGNCSKERLFALYQGAHCLLYTSRYEGFGLPPLEAMTCGCPVVACRASSIPEVTGDAAILVSPGAVDEVARAIDDLQDAATRHSLVQRGIKRAALFSWDECARKHMEVYLSVRG